MALLVTLFRRALLPVLVGARLLLAHISVVAMELDRRVLLLLCLRCSIRLYSPFLISIIIHTVGHFGHGCSTVGTAAAGATGASFVVFLAASTLWRGTPVVTTVAITTLATIFGVTPVAMIFGVTPVAMMVLAHYFFLFFDYNIADLCNLMLACTGGHPTQDSRRGHLTHDLRATDFFIVTIRYKTEVPTRERERLGEVLEKKNTPESSFKVLVRKAEHGSGQACLPVVRVS